jgi:hypothetical protein
MSIEVLMELDLPNATDNWNMYKLCKIVSMKDVIKYRYAEWDKSLLSRNPNLSMTVITMKLPNSLENWNWTCISRTRSSVDDVISYPHLPWNLTALSSNTKVDISQLIHTILPNATGQLDWRRISKIVSMSTILSYPHLPWSGIGLYNNNNIDVDILDLSIDTSYLTKVISERTHISKWRSILRYKHSLHQCKGITPLWIDIIEKKSIYKNRSEVNWKYDIDIICYK